MSTSESSDPSAHVPTPALLLTPSNLQAFRVVDPSEDGQGSAIAARKVARCVKRARARYPAAVAPEWVAEYQTVAATLEAAGQDASPGFLTVSDSSKGSKLFTAFVRPPKSNLSAAQTERLEAAVGLVAVASASVGRKLAVSFISTYMTLLNSGAPRKGRHPDFSALMSDFPETPDQLKSWINRDTDAGIQRFAATILEALESPIQAPDALITPRSRAQQPSGAPNPQEADGLADATPGASGSTKSQQPKSQQPTSDDDDQLEPSLIAWLRGRSEQAGYRARFGSKNRWDKQTVDELIAICGHISQALRIAHPNRRFALFAVISLITSLPAAKAAQIKLGSTTDLWLDLPLRAVRWNLVRLLKPERAQGMSPEEASTSEVVDVWLPTVAADVAVELSAQYPEANDLLDLIAGTDQPYNRSAVIEGYRRWLRSIGVKSLHGVEDARFARSLGQIYRMLSGDVVAALLSFDMDECSLGMLHYVQLLRSFLHRLNDDAYAWLGLGPAVPMGLPDGPVGSTIALTLDELGAALQRVQNDVDCAVSAMRVAETADELIAAFHLVVHLRLLVVIILCAGRGDRLERLTWAAVFGHLKYLHLADKDIDNYSKDRFVSIHRYPRATLDCYVGDIQLLCERAQALGISVTDARGRRFDDLSPSRICFTVAYKTEINGAVHLARTGISRELLVRMAGNYFGELNAGRHTIVSLAVQYGVDPTLLKALTGHFRGHAEPFSDGQWISPANALSLLGQALDWIFAPILPRFTPPTANSVIDLMQWKSRLPSKASEEYRSADSRVRVLPQPFDSYTTLSLRAIDHLRQKVTSGAGPSHQGANRAGNLMLVNWIRLSDLKAFWQSPGELTALGQKCVAATWRRDKCIARIRRPLVGTAALSYQAPDEGLPSPTWDQVCSQLAAWLRSSLPMLSWPDKDEQVVEALDALLARWLRVNVPPFLLTASSARITAATANARSVCRLVADPQPVNPDEVLVHPAARPRGHGNRKKRPSALQDSIAVVHELGTSRGKKKKGNVDSVEDEDDVTTEGENWARMKEMVARHALIDTTAHAPAATYQEVAAEEASRWEGSKGDRIKISSFSTYTRLIEAALDLFRPDEDLRHCEADFWHDFFAYLKTSARAKTPEKLAELIKDRHTAARRFVKILAALGYNIPQDLLDAGDEVRHDGMRNSAASTLLLEADRRRTTSLMARHFAQIPLTRLLAPLYSELRFECSLRSIEAAVLPVIVVTPSGCMVITTDGFAHMKSLNARRLIFVGVEFADRVRAAADVVSLNCAGAKWLFLTNDRKDWSLIDEIEEAHSAALKQGTSDPSARPHATRAVLPLEQLFPKWEAMLRRFLQGKATTAECVAFCAEIRSLGFGHLEEVIVGVGHGHSLTFIRYYFAIWDLILSVYAQASLDGHAHATQAIKTSGAAIHAAFRKAEERARAAKAPLDPWTWMRGYRQKASEFVDIASYVGVQAPLVVTTTPATVATTRGTFEHSQIKYLALRATGQVPVAAARSAKLTTSDSAMLETNFSAASVGHLTQRHQGKLTPGGIKSEIRYLESADGALLIKHLRSSSRATLGRFAEALTPMRAGNIELPPPEVIRATLASYAACLPPSLSVMAQYGHDVLTPDQIARINSTELRILVGPSDGDLGKRPRISIFETGNLNSTAARARRKSNVRCAIAAIQLLDAHKET